MKNKAIEYKMVFGMSKPNGGQAITKQDWRLFVRKAIAPRFPQGFTIYTGEGQWEQVNGEIVREVSNTVLIVSDFPQSQEHIREIVAAYKRCFNQESVMVTMSTVHVEF